MARPDSELEQYLEEISRFKLLTREQEIELAERIAVGDNEARKELIRRNLRLVVAIARNYMDRGLPLMDLIEEGNIGLMKAVTRFSTEPGCKFSTYASWWIKQTIRRALINKVRSVRIPAYMIELISKYRKAATALEQEKGREPTQEEVGKALKMKPKRVKQIVKSMNAYIFSASGSEGDSSTGMFDIPDASTLATPPSLLDMYDGDSLYESMFHCLDEREQQIVWLRYGLDPDHPKPLTLEKIGQTVGLTRERVRQIEHQALQKLKTFILDREEQERNGLLVWKSEPGARRDQLAAKLRNIVPTEFLVESGQFQVVDREPLPKDDANDDADEDSK